MMTTARPADAAACARSLFCVNFLLEERPGCNQCGTPVRGDHFHDNVQGYRICAECFRHNLAAIVAHAYRPASHVEDEVRICRNRERCYEHGPYGMFADKTCDRCGALHPPEHYHDVARNARICLACLSSEVKA